MKNFSAVWAAVLLCGLAAAYVAPESVTAMLAFLLIWSLRGSEECIQSLTLATLLTYLSPAIAPPTAESGVVARVVLIAAALRILPSMRAQDVRLLWPVWLFAVVAALLSVVSSSSIPISIMKVLTFAVAVSTVLTAFGSLSAQRIERLKIWFATLGGMFVVLSLLTLAVPRIAFLRNGTGFQGILNHPQALAAALTPFAAWQLTGVLFNRKGLRWLGVASVAAIYGALFLSESRTGIAASLIGVAAAAITWLTGAGRTRLLAGRGRVALVAGGAVAFLGVALATGHFQSTLVKFAFKRADSREVSGAFFESRGSGILSQWQNFVDQPWLGHGFGVFAEGPSASSVVEVLGIPISAPVEKGFVFTAVLEETGLIGGMCFLLMLMRLAVGVWKTEDLRWIAMFTTCIAVNIGESIILAPGGIGLFDWLLIGLALVAARPGTAISGVTAFPGPAEVRFPNLLRY